MPTLDQATKLPAAPPGLTLRRRSSVRRDPLADAENERPDPLKRPATHIPAPTRAGSVRICAIGGAGKLQRWEGMKQDALPSMWIRIYPRTE
jgi:hypothetical protein